MEPKVAAALLRTQNLTPEEMVNFALASMDRFDSKSLVLLAGETAPTMSSCEPLLRSALQELNIVEPELPEAYLASARHFAQLVLDGKVSPYRGAATIWTECANPAQEIPGVWDKLSKFVGLAIEIEEDNRERVILDSEIERECKLLVTG